MTVCDYLFERDKIYAYLNLDDNELFVYQRLYELLAQDVPAPDLVIYLQTPTDVLRQRLRERARANPDAPSLDDDYIRELNEAYNHFFFHYNATPLLVVETSQLDLILGGRSARRSRQAAAAAWATGRDTTCRGRNSRAEMADARDARNDVTDTDRPTIRHSDPSISDKLASMAWFKKPRKPMAAPPKQSRVPEGLWVKCPSCSEIIYNKDLAAGLNVCPKCGHHFRMGAADRLKMLFDGEWTEYDAGLQSTDPLKFTDTKPYRHAPRGEHRRDRA